MRLPLKRALKIAGLSAGGFVCIAAVVVALNWSAFAEGMHDWLGKKYEALVSQAIQTEVTHLPEVDTVKVVALSYEPTFSGQQPFAKAEKDPVYEGKSVTLTGEDGQKLAALWRSLEVTENHAMCHNPNHALRFYHRGKQVSQAIICFHCINAGIPCRFIGTALVQFDLTSPPYRELQKRIEGLVGAAP